METYIINYNISTLTAPTRMRSKEFTNLQRAQHYYNACLNDWHEKALKEYEADKANGNRDVNFVDYFAEDDAPESWVLARFGGEFGWTRYWFSLEKV